MAVKDGMEKIYFKEEQSLRNSPVMWILFVTFFVVAAISGWGLYQQVVLEKPFGNLPTSNVHLELVFALPLIVMIVVMFLVSRIRLVTIINEKGIRFGFTTLTNQKFIAKVVLSSFGVNFLGRRTFKMGQNFVSKEEIGKYEIRKYKAFLEFGGWGYRRSGQKLFSKEKAGIAFTVNGNQGLQLYLTTQAKILIGTQEPEGVKRAMKKLMNEGGITNV
ncbi:MAG: hypothetical protein IH595_08410 [Bacteroidales bacterium]|nr:hypothetical protein [Bacteroidales bacterium]